MERQPRRRQTIGVWVCLAIAAVATIAAMGLMAFARSIFQIRTLPERIMEWLLLFVPLETFEKGVQQFGPEAKDYALYGANVVMFIVLVGLGFLVLRSGWPDWGILGVGLGLWCFAMAVVMPVTGAGFFASGLFQNVWLVNASYLGIVMAYSTVLLIGKLLSKPRTAQNADETLVLPTVTSRRPLLMGLAGLFASYAVVTWASKQSPVSSNLPLAQIKPQAPPAPSPSPDGATARVVASAPTAPPAAAPGVVAANASPPPTAPPSLPATGPTPGALPVPPPERELVRDKDGSLTAAGRKPGELSPQFTSNANFYIVTKNAGGDPIIKPESWRLIVDGEVNSPVQLDYKSLRQLPSTEQIKTLECISNFTDKCDLTSFGCELISTARWKGVRLKDVLELAGGIKPSAVALAILSTDEFSSAIPIDAAMDPDTMLAYEMNGEVLPYEHGYPARLLVPGRYGLKNAKWVMALRPMNQQFVDFYGQRNWNKEAIVKTMSRIDVPAPGAELATGSQRIAGVAYAGNRGIKSVEFSADGGKSWQPASFVEPAPNNDSWLRWQGTFSAPSGTSLTLTSRATDGTGEVQTETFSLPQPDGGSGRNSIQVKVRSD